MIDRYAIQERLEQLIGDYLKSENITLVDLILKHKGRKFILRILVDEPAGGITLDRCVSLNNSIGKLLDEQGVIQERYILEVSSPGIDRPLLTRDDFSRCLKRKVIIFLNTAQDNQVSGIIESVTDTAVNIQSEEGEIKQVSFEQIIKAKQLIG